MSKFSEIWIEIQQFAIKKNAFDVHNKGITTTTINQEKAGYENDKPIYAALYQTCDTW